MSKFIEKLSDLERRLQAIQSKIAPFSERTNQLNSELATLSERLKTAAEKSAALADEVTEMRTNVDSLLTTLLDAKTDGTQMDARQEENRELHDSLTVMFGETFQVVNRFFDTARKLGLVEKDKEPKFFEDKEVTSREPEPVAEEPIPEPEAVETVAEPVAEEPMPEPEQVETVAEPVAEEPMPEPEAVETVAEPAVEEPLQEPENTAPFGEFSESDFSDLLMETAPAREAAEPELPPLPDVTSSTDSLPPVREEEEIAEQSSAEIADRLDLSPLPLHAEETPESDASTEIDEQKIEDLLNDLSKPIST